MITSNTEAIIKMTWSRRLGLPDEALNGDGRLMIESEDVEVLQLWGSVVLRGPLALLEAAGELDEDELADPVRLGRLLAATQSTTNRLRPAETLRYGEDYVDVPGAEQALIAREPEAVAELSQGCPPDDVLDARPADWQQAFVGVEDDPGHRPVAGAGYAETSGLMGRLSALTALGARRRGQARVVAGLALNDALDAGLVVEATVPVGNVAADRLARSLGLVGIGRRIRPSSR